MPLPQLTLPVGTPTFRAVGHEIQQASQFANPRFQTGHSRARRVWTTSERTVGVSLLLSHEQAAAVHAWLEADLVRAGGRFAAHVANDESDEAARLWWTAEFEQPPTWTPRGRARWTLTATLRLTGVGQVERPYTGLLRYRERAPLVGSVVGTVVPGIAFTSTARLLPQSRLGFSSEAALLQQIRVGYAESAALLSA